MGERDCREGVWLVLRDRCWWSSCVWGEMPDEKRGRGASMTAQSRVTKTRPVPTTPPPFLTWDASSPNHPSSAKASSVALCVAGDVITYHCTLCCGSSPFPNATSAASRWSLAMRSACEPQRAKPAVGMQVLEMDLPVLSTRNRPSAASQYKTARLERNVDRKQESRALRDWMSAGAHLQAEEGLVGRQSDVVTSFRA